MHFTVDLCCHEVPIKERFANNMEEAGPQALEMPENISESGMMMGAMVMAKPSLAGGLPGAMAPPEGMTAPVSFTLRPPGGTTSSSYQQGPSLGSRADIRLEV